MNKHKIINILAIIILIIGVVHQLYSDAYIEDGNDHGTLIVIAGLGISTINEFTKLRSKKQEQ